jgi:hypothetical protein
VQVSTATAALGAITGAAHAAAALCHLALLCTLAWLLLRARFSVQKHRPFAWARRAAVGSCVLTIAVAGLAFFLACQYSFTSSVVERLNKEGYRCAFNRKMTAEVSVTFNSTFMCIALHTHQALP